MPPQSKAARPTAFSDLPCGLVRQIAAALVDPKDQARLACAAPLCREAVEPLAPALYHFASKGNAAAVLRLVQQPRVRASLDARHGRWRKTALHAAAAENHPEVVSILCSAGASQAADNIGNTPLSIAAGRGHIDVCIRLLAANPSAVETKDDDRCLPLWEASINGHLEVVQLLIRAGVDVDAKAKGPWLSQTPPPGGVVCALRCRSRRRGGDFGAAH